MTPQQFLQTLQFNDSLFPTGGFAYSDGLESAVSNQLACDTNGLRQWLKHYVDAVFPNCDGRAIRQTMDAHRRGDWTAIQTLDFECTALKPAAAVRSSSRSLGKGFLKSVMSVHAEADLDRLALDIEHGRLDGNIVVIYAVVFAIFEFRAEDVLLSFAYSRIAGMVSAALRLMAIGQQQAQAELRKALDSLPAVVERIMQGEDEPVMSFSPMLDIQQMNHRYVYSRLFRS